MDEVLPVSLISSPKSSGTSLMWHNLDNARILGCSTLAKGKWLTLYYVFSTYSHVDCGGDGKNIIW